MLRGVRASQREKLCASCSAQGAAALTARRAAAGAAARAVAGAGLAAHGGVCAVLRRDRRPSAVDEDTPAAATPSLRAGPVRVAVIPAVAGRTGSE